MTTGRAGNGAARYNHHFKEPLPMSTYTKEQIARLTELPRLGHHLAHAFHAQGQGDQPTC
jgi:hypothetical protein